MPLGKASEIYNTWDNSGKIHTRLVPEKLKNTVERSFEEPK